MGKITLTFNILLVGLILNLKVSAENTDETRFSLNNTEDFIEQRASVLSIKLRAVDPFGQPQDLSKKVVKNNKPRRAAPKKKVEILIEQEIHKLGQENINIMRRNLVINGTPFKRNDKINVTVRGKRFPLKINSFTSSKITFLDLTNNKLISLKLNNGAFLPVEEVNPTLENDQTEFGLRE